MIKEIKILVMILLIIFLTGCWDAKDVDKRSIVQSTGVDLADNQIEISSEISQLIPQDNKNSNASKSSNVYTDTSYGENFEEARVDYNSKRPYPTFLGATRVIVFGTSLAKEGIEPYLNRVNKFFDYRKTVPIVISRESPSKLFELEVEKDLSVGYYIEDIISSFRENGNTVYKQVGDILSHISLGNVGYILPYIGIEQESIKYLGLAIMKDSKLQDIIELKECKGFLFLVNNKIEFNEVIDGFKNPNNKYSFKICCQDKKISTNFDDQIEFNLELKIDAKLQYQYYLETLSEKEIKKCEEILKSNIENCIKKTFIKSTKNWENDIFQLARHFKADHPLIYRKIDWEEEYTKSKLNLLVVVKIKDQFLFDSNANRSY